jgi:hypothetical protein
MLVVYSPVIHHSMAKIIYPRFLGRYKFSNLLVHKVAITNLSYSGVQKECVCLYNTCPQYPCNAFLKSHEVKHGYIV